MRPETDRAFHGLQDGSERTASGDRIGLAGLQGVELTRAMGNPQGSLPFSVIFDRTGNVADRKLGAISPGDLTRWTSSLG